MPSDGAVSIDPNDKAEAKLSSEDSCFKSVDTAAQSEDDGDGETQLMEKLKNLELAEAALEKQR